MIGISKLYCSTIEPSDILRYGRQSSRLPSSHLQFSIDKKPVVVWNVTKKCNLHCIHCYSQSTDKKDEYELTTEEGMALLEDLSALGSPVILFSGGEPLIREDIFELAQYAKTLGMRVVLSTNGTLINPKTANKIKNIGVSYVGISLDGMQTTNDLFRGSKGAFRRALKGIRECQKNEIKVGLRFTISKNNFQDIPSIFDLIEQENIPRICFYHLVYSGRGSKLMEHDLSHEQTRKVVDLIIDRTYDLHRKGQKTEVLTVDNHSDGVYLYLRMLKEGNPKANDVLTLLQMNGGNNTGIAIGCVSWNGEVYADQFWRHYSFGNVKEKKFSNIWNDINEPLMGKLKNRKKHLKGRCAQCKWLDICNGNFRVRAEAQTGDLWEADPACYLTDEEIGLDPHEEV